MSIEEVESLISKSDSEFEAQQDLSAKRIEHVKLIQDKLLNHIANIESINQYLESKMQAVQGEEKTRIAKTLSFNYDRLIKLYEVYQEYEQVIQRYHVHQTDVINKKYQININSMKSGLSDKNGDSINFFRKLNDYLSSSSKEEIENISKINDPRFNL